MDENSRHPVQPLGRFGQCCRLAVAVVAGLLAGISCMSIDIGSHTVEVANLGTAKQEGTFNPVGSPQGVVEVYYPRPYSSPPNLQISTSDNFWKAADYVELIDQKADHFTYRRLGAPPSSIELKWKAEGVPAALNAGEAGKAIPAGAAPAAVEAANGSSTAKSPSDPGPPVVIPVSGGK